MSEHSPFAGSGLHTLAPSDPKNGDRFSCECCEYAAEFVVLDDGKPGEWVDITPAERDCIGNALGSICDCRTASDCPMTTVNPPAVQHSHTEYVEGCFRCDLSREETTVTPPELRKP